MMSLGGCLVDLYRILPVLCPLCLVFANESECFEPHDKKRNPGCATAASPC